MAGKIKEFRVPSLASIRLSHGDFIHKLSELYNKLYKMLYKKTDKAPFDE
ncbi:hypothetical protein [Campylobacter lanienae]|nr:hypothetical protein [Campylobacter lanienae]